MATYFIASIRCEQRPGAIITAIHELSGLSVQTQALLPIHQAQLLSYLKLANKHLGLLINFNTVHLRDGIKRIVHQL
jgi:hypothetical protein